MTASATGVLQYHVSAQDTADRMSAHLHEAFLDAPPVELDTSKAKGLRLAIRELARRKRIQA